jgi:LPXTG-motif cell wall-anchored protein
VVTVTNTGVLPIDVTVAGQQATVDPGQGHAFTVPVGEGAYSIDVSIPDFPGPITGTRDCEEPGIESVDVDCAEGGVVVVLTNTGEQDTTVLVNGEPVNVPAGGTAEVLVPVDENADYEITIVGDDGLDESFSGTLDCDHPDPRVEQEMDCTPGGGVTVTLINDGDDTAFFVVSSPVLEDGAEAEFTPAGTTEIAVEPGEVATLNLPVAEDATTELTVTSGGTTLYDDPVTRDCETVGGEVETPTPLPRTGANTTGLLGLAGALLLAGLALVGGARRREARVSR